MSLTFQFLRAMNRKRLPQFRNAQGRLTHVGDDGKDWPLSKWANAVLGELGEAANLIKKIERGDFTLEQIRDDLGEELADVATYLDLLSCAAEIELGDAVAAKFNLVSERVGANAFIPRRRMAYLASPHSHPDAQVREDRYRAVCRAAAWMFRHGLWVYAPIAHTHQIAIDGEFPADFDAWREYDRHMLSLCDRLCVLKLDGWKESKGVQAEIAMASEFHLPVEYLDPATLELV